MSILKEFKEKNKKLRDFRYIMERENFRVNRDNDYSYGEWKITCAYSEEDVIKKINEFYRDLNNQYHKYRLHKLYELVEVDLDEYAESFQ